MRTQRRIFGYSIKMGPGVRGVLLAGIAAMVACLSKEPDPGQTIPEKPATCLDFGLVTMSFIRAVDEGDAKGTYKVTIDPSEVGSYNTLILDRDVTYNSDASAKYPGCHVTSRFIQLDAYTGLPPQKFLGIESRENCIEPVHNVTGTPVQIYPFCLDAVNDVITVAADCSSIQIKSYVYTSIDLWEGSGGSGGGGGSGGSGGAGGAPECTPAFIESCYDPVPCYIDIIDDCVPSGICTAGEQKVIGDELVAPFCFANGVKIQVETLVGDPFVSALDAYKSNGDFCWHIDSTTTPSGDGTLVYKNKNQAGDVLATVERQGSKTSITCAGMPQVTLAEGCSACDLPGSSPGTGSNCVEGACSVP